MSKSSIPRIFRKAIVAAVALRQAYLLVVVGLAVALVGLVLAIIDGDVAQAIALSAGVVVVLVSLAAALVVADRRRKRQVVLDELAQLDEWSAKRRILAHG